MNSKKNIIILLKYFLFLIIIISVNMNIVNAADIQDEEILLSENESSESSQGKLYLRNSILYGTVPVTILFGAKVWHWGENHSFRSENEHWFGIDTTHGGADKAGHIYTHYLFQRINYAIFDYTENGKFSKWFYSAGCTLAIGTLIEVGDGFSASYGFSFQDLVVDIGGLMFGVLIDAVPHLDDFLGMSVEYIPTEGYRASNDVIPMDFVNDYSGWKTMLNFKLAGFEKIGWNVPSFLKYIMLDAGFYTRGFEIKYDFDENNQNVYGKPNQNLFVGVSINLMEIIRDFYSDKNSRLCRYSQKPFEYYHVPVGFKSSKSRSTNFRSSL